MINSDQKFDREFSQVTREDIGWSWSQISGRDREQPTDVPFLNNYIDVNLMGWDVPYITSEKWS